MRFLFGARLVSRFDRIGWLLIERKLNAFFDLDQIAAQAIDMNLEPSAVAAHLHYCERKRCGGARMRAISNRLWCESHEMGDCPDGDERSPRRDFGKKSKRCGSWRRLHIGT
ncbi:MULTISPECIES: hypothetical protein [Solimonas]|uniref:hypothetical protein n=1 Tax=Solimonas TaxID=413435 RepID=UPI000484643F|nr:MULTISPECIES: hypothetical protein [Solimonas]